ncbi:MAG: FadR/GntR family transcriptional regulator [Caldilineaceae bacterium]
MLTPSARNTISDDAVASIIQMVRDKKYAPGDRLPGERQLAEQLKVSRTSIRAALGRLVTLGLLEARAGSGTYVKEPSSEPLLAALAPHVVSDHNTLRNLFELREMIEVEAAGRAAERATLEQIDKMRYWADQVAISAQQKDRPGLVRADVEFHRQIVIATGNPILVDLIDSVADLLREMRYVSTNDPQLLPGQRSVLVAIEARDSQQARQAMINHLQTVRAKAELFLKRET